MWIVRDRCVVILALVFILVMGCGGEQSTYQPGDIVFQSLDSPQCEAIRLATGSEYTHCGIVLKAEDGILVVAEAVQPVRIIPLDEWIAQGVEQEHLVMRLKNAEFLSDAILSDMLDEARALQGINYDILFNWSDDELYCSEFVWKTYDRVADIQLTELRELGSFDLTHPVVQAKLEERYGEEVPLEEPVVAPSDLVESPLLQSIYEGE